MVQKRVLDDVVVFVHGNNVGVATALSLSHPVTPGSTRRELSRVIIDIRPIVICLQEPARGRGYVCCCPFLPSKDQVVYCARNKMPKKRLRYARNQIRGGRDYDDRLLLTPLSLDRFRMRTGLVTRMQLSRRSLARHTGVATKVSMPWAGMS